MFRTLVLFGLVFLCTELAPATRTSAQNNVGIGTAVPDASSLVDMTSTTLGFLAPRMTKAQRDAISNPARGLIVFVIDSLTFYYNTSNIPATPNWVTWLSSANGVQYDITTTQNNSLVRTDWLYNVAYNAAAADANAAGAQITSTGGATNRTATGLTITATATGNGNATGLNVTAAGATGTLRAIDATGRINVNSTASHDIGGNRWVYAGNAGANNTLLGNTSNTVMTGGNNTLVGASAGAIVNGATSNTLVGSSAGVLNISGVSNTLVGASAGSSTTGGSNTFLGANAGVTTVGANANTTGTNNTYIGTNAGPGAASTGITNAAAIGNAATVTASNSLVLGSINGNNGAAANTNVGIGTTAPGASLEIAPTVTAVAAATTYSEKIDPTLSGAIAAAQTAYYSIYKVPTINLSGGLSNTLTNLYNHYTGLTATAGTISNYYGNYIAAPTGAGTITAKYALVTESSAGNVGIGTIAPGANLEIAPTTTAVAAATNYAQKIDPTLSGAIALAQTAYYGSYSVPTINLSGGLSNTLTTLYNHYIGTTATAGTISTLYGLYLAAPTGAGIVTTKYALVTEANAGNVGIGTTAPTTELLDVAGNVGLTNSTNAAAELRLYEPSGSGANYSALKTGVQAGNITYTLPTTAPAVNQVLTAGAVTATNLVWAASGASLWTAGTGTGAVFDVGSGNSANGNYAIAAGQNNAATGNYAVTMGESNTVTGVNSAAFGYGANVSQDNTVVFNHPSAASQTLVGIRTNAPVASLDVNGDIAMRYAGFTASNGANNDISIGSRSFLRITGPSAAFSITGISGGTDGKVVVLYNGTAQKMTIANDNASSTTAADRIYTLTNSGTGDYTVNGNGTATLIYSAADSRWLAMAPPTSSSSAVAYTVKRKTSDQTITSSTTLTNDNDLFFSIGANEVQEIDGFLDMAGGGGDGKIAFTVPAGATLDVGGHCSWNGVNHAEIYSFTITSAGTGTAISLDPSFDNPIFVHGIIANGGTAGTIHLQFAQNASNATGTKLKTNSFLKVTTVP